jgi:hypothetical protein
MAGVFIPTMGIKGWINATEDVADYMVACFMESNPSQLVFSRDQSTSLQYLLKENAGFPTELETKLQSALDKKLKTVFGDQSYANVTVDNKPDDDTKFTINFTGYIITAERSYTLGRAVQIQDSRVVKIAEINNGV